MKIVNAKASTAWASFVCTISAVLALAGEVWAMPPVSPDHQSIPTALLKQISLAGYPESAALQAYVKHPWPACQRGEHWQWSTAASASATNLAPSTPKVIPRFQSLDWQCEQPAAKLKGLAHLHVWVPVWVAKRNLAAGQRLTSTDLDQRWVDALVQPSLRSHTATVSKEDLDNLVIKKPLMAGQTLQESWLRHQDELDSGQRVTLRLQGRGFALDSEAVLMQPARVGHTVKVKTPQGKVLTGQLDRDGMVNVQ